jgi:F-type H+-transporting ATPase subunit delta
VPPDRKLDVLRRALGEQLGGLEYELLRILLEQGLGGQLPEVVKALILLARTIDTGARLTVYSPEPMAAKELAGLSRKLEQDLGRDVRATAVTQPALLGGLKLRLDNLLVDGSIQSRLERVRRELA